MTKGDKFGMIAKHSQKRRRNAAEGRATEEGQKKPRKNVKKVLDKGEELWYNSLRRFGNEASQADLEN